MLSIWKPSCTGCCRVSQYGCPESLSAGYAQAFCWEIRLSLAHVGWCMVATPADLAAPSASWARFSYSHTIRKESFYICTPAPRPAPLNACRLAFSNG